MRLMHLIGVSRTQFSGLFQIFFSKMDREMVHYPYRLTTVRIMHHFKRPCFLHYFYLLRWWFVLFAVSISELAGGVAKKSWILKVLHRSDLYIAKLSAYCQHKTCTQAIQYQLYQKLFLSFKHFVSDEADLNWFFFHMWTRYNDETI